MRILFVSIEPPLPMGSASGRGYHAILRELYRRGHEVTAFSTCRSPEESTAVQAVFTGHDVRCYPHPHRSGPFRKAESWLQPYSYVFSRQFKDDLLHELTRGFDVLDLYQVWSGWLGLHWGQRALLTVHYLLDIDFGAAVGLEGRLRKRLSLSRERYLLNHYPNITTLTPRLSARVAQLAPGARVWTLPLALDLSPYRVASSASSDCVVGLVGSFDWHATRNAAQRLLNEVWPGIKQRLPHARLRLVGRHAAQFAARPDVSIAADVDNVLPHFADLSLLLYLPEHASGMKVKVLEAFALGVPVLSNDEGVEGLPVEDGIHALLASSNHDAIDRAVALLQNNALQTSLRTAARQLVEAQCDPTRNVDRLEHIYRAVIDGGKRTTPGC